MTDPTLLEKTRHIAKIAAQIYAGKDRQSLTPLEIKLVKKLEEQGFIEIRKPANGFVGKAH